MDKVHIIRLSFRTWPRTPSSRFYFLIECCMFIHPSRNRTYNDSCYVAKYAFFKIIWLCSFFSSCLTHCRRIIFIYSSFRVYFLLWYFCQTAHKTDSSRDMIASLLCCSLLIMSENRCICF